MQSAFCPPTTRAQRLAVRSQITWAQRSAPDSFLEFSRVQNWKILRITIITTSTLACYITNSRVPELATPAPSSSWARYRSTTKIPSGSCSSPSIAWCSPWTCSATCRWRPCAFVVGCRGRRFVSLWGRKELRKNKIKINKKGKKEKRKNKKEERKKNNFTRLLSLPAHALARTLGGPKLPSSSTQSTATISDITQHTYHISYTHTHINRIHRAAWGTKRPISLHDLPLPHLTYQYIHLYRDICVYVQIAPTN